MRKIDKYTNSNINIDELGIELYSFGEFQGAYSNKHHDSKISNFFDDLMQKITEGASEEELTVSIKKFLLDTTATDNWTGAIFVRGEKLFSYIGEWGYYIGYRYFEEDEDFVYFDVDDEDDDDEDWNNDDDDVEED